MGRLAVAVLVALFVRIGATVGVAAALVVLMLAYMVCMGTLARRNIERGG